jgi:hypothetical protein
MASDFYGWSVCDDVQPAEWFRPALAPFPSRTPLRVDEVVPAAYPAHGRIVHPAYDASGDQRVLLRDIDQPHLAHWEGDPRFALYAGDWPFIRGGPWNFLTPTVGSLDPVDISVVAEILGFHTSTPDVVWALMWNGWGVFTSELPEPQHLVRASRTWEHYLLLRGELSAVESMVRACEQAPSFWWPDDRAWVVGADLDTWSTYVAASAEAIEQVVADQRIEAYPATPDDSCFPVPFVPYAT